MSPVKETNFFALRGVTQPYGSGPGDSVGMGQTITEQRDYEALFADAGQFIVRGEASPLYLYSESASRNIASTIPDVKIIAMLRNPVDRAYSHYSMMRRDGREPETNFLAALEMESGRIKAGWEWGWHYASVGFYGQQLQRYLRLFPRKNLLVLLYDDFCIDPKGVLTQICEFLRIRSDQDWYLAERYNRSGSAKFPALQRVFSTDHPIKKLSRRVVPQPIRHKVARSVMALNINHGVPGLSEATRASLLEQYTEDIALLECLIDRDLSHWRAGPAE